MKLPWCVSNSRKRQNSTSWVQKHWYFRLVIVYDETNVSKFGIVWIRLPTQDFTTTRNFVSFGGSILTNSRHLSGLGSNSLNSTQFSWPKQLNSTQNLSNSLNSTRNHPLVKTCHVSVFCLRPTSALFCLRPTTQWFAHGLSLSYSDSERLFCIQPWIM